MWIYMKNLEYPVNITTPNVKMAKALMAQYGGPDSELSAATRYLTQRFTMPDDRTRATLNDIGSDVSTMAHFLCGHPAICCMCQRIAPFMRHKNQIYVDVIAVIHHHAVEHTPIEHIVINKPACDLIYSGEGVFYHFVLLVCRISLQDYALYHVLAVCNFSVALFTHHHKFVFGDATTHI